MEIILETKPKSPIIIEGFPGFGLVGTIATEYLIEHLGAKQIGKISVKETAPVIAIHNGEVIEPIGIFYAQKYNIIILHALTSITGIEWKLAGIVENLAKMLKSKEIISIEGVGAQIPSENVAAYYLSAKKSKFEKIGVPRLKEGIVMGVTGALLLNKSLNLSSLFIETPSALPDSRAAAKAIEVLDKYLGLKVDPKPLFEKSEKFEKKIKTLMEKGNSASKIQKEKELSYMG